jgi:hypothetical protein
MNPWYAKHCSDYANLKLAYFSTEFVVYESIPIKICKCDMGRPLVGVGLL